MAPCRGRQDRQGVRFRPVDGLPIHARRLHAITRARSHDAERAWDVVCVSLSGGGRGQIAAALITLLSENRVAVHCAGTAVHGRIDPGVRAVINELGVDADEALARPVTDDMLRAADVILTMGHSVGVIDIPQQIRHEDWRVVGPIGAPDRRDTTRAKRHRIARPSPADRPRPTDRP